MKTFADFVEPVKLVRRLSGFPADQQIQAEYSLELTQQFQQTPSDTIKQQSPLKLRSRL